MVKNLRIATRLYLLVFFISSLTIVIGIYGMSNTATIDGMMKAGLDKTKVFSDGVDTARDAQVTFKKQVQEWKDILLRGSDPEAFKKYSAGFAKQEEKVQENLKKLKTIMETIGISSTMVDEALKVHDMLGVKYREALKSYDPNNGNSYKIVDTLVKGIDRAPTDSIDGIVKYIKEKQSASISELQNSGNQKYNSTRNITIGLIITIVFLSLFTAAILIRKIMKSLLYLKETTESAAGGDLTKDALVVSDDEIGELANSFNTMLGSLRNIISKIFSGVSLLAEVSEELNSTMTTILQMIDEQTNKTGQISTSSTQMSQTVVDIARNASDMAASAANTLKVANDGSSIVEKTGKEVKEISKTVLSLFDVINSLGERSKQIGEIISVIKDIADQTNLLALNAAIEAARAGEQGRGFAVVADEVRKLAERTGKSTTEISGMINSIQEETTKAIKSVQDGTKSVETGVKLAEQAKMSLDKIVETAGNLHSMVQHIATSTEEMSTVSGTISEDISAVAVISDETSGHSHKILESVNKLQTLSADLQRTAGQFDVGEKVRTHHSSNTYQKRLLA
ncbi:MAG: HAMP domain-containing protein [Nitrospirae bacterium]|nr:HAMP domain-containing protein [Nitrospirota bacterium]MBF0535322.1 HAMP domain-containing protein [Nitrospirota bacterium]MBF0617255.1 HAMP domain-containing protein [Nitrospirota bacterium]